MILSRNDGKYPTGEKYLFIYLRLCQITIKRLQTYSLFLIKNLTFEFEVLK